MGLTMSCVIRSTTTHRKGLLMLDSSEPLVFISSEQALLYLENNTGIKNAVVFPVTDFYDDKIPPNIAGENAETESSYMRSHSQTTNRSHWR
jgi:hypothetical protein